MSKPHSAYPPIVLVGPTAIGKTEVAYHLALSLDAEIINADSMQIYVGMNIGTAKPGLEMRKNVHFHMLDVVYPDQPFNVSTWKERTESILEDIASRDKIAIICGGTGLYIRALLEGWSMAGTPSDQGIRSQLYEEAKVQGNESLHRRLVSIDPMTAERLHPNDQVRIIRALEVYEATGKTLSSFQHKDKQQVQHRKAIRFGLLMARPGLIDRINARVDRMIENGLEQEVKKLLAAGYSHHLGPLRSLGYKEMVAFLSGNSDFHSTVEEIKKSTRHYSKRQMTWFRADTQVQWIDTTDLTTLSTVSHLIGKLDAGLNYP